jgi:GT2 family glycosyltransferase
LCVEREAFAVTGAMLCVDRRLFEDVGGFDEGYWYGYEDVDLCLKVRQKGRSVIYSPDAVAEHHESATLRTRRDSAAAGRNYELFRRKWAQALEPRERVRLDEWRRGRVRRAVVFGTGVAAEGLFRALEGNDIAVVAFTCSSKHRPGDEFLGRPVLPLDRLGSARYDRVFVGTQYYLEIEEELLKFVSADSIVFPVVE